MSQPWADWLAALLTRAGGSGDVLTNAELATLLTSLTVTTALTEGAGSPPATAPSTALDALGALELPPRRTHLVGGPPAPPSVAAVTAGAGAGATASVSGSDTAGSITLSVAALAERRSNSEILRLTFAVAFAAAPVVIVSPSNDAAWALHFGRFLRNGHAASVRVRQSDVTTTGFPLRVGVTRLPSDAATYSWNYLAIGT